MISIPCKQFIYGKMLGAPRGSYRVVASSDNVSDEFVTKVRQVFQGCRPQSVDVNIFSTTLIATPFLEENIVLLRMEHFHDHDLGHFIQEHYVVIEKDHLFKQTTLDYFESKPWFWLLNIASIELYSSFEEIPNTIALNFTAAFGAQVGKFISLLSTQDNIFEDVLKNTISLLLNAPPAFIQIKDDDFLTKQFWCIALSLLLPARETSNLRIYIGKTSPEAWAFDLGVVTGNPVAQKSRSGESTNIKTEMLEKKFPKLSVLIERCLDISRSEKFIRQLITMIDKVKVDWQSPLIQDCKNNLDVAFGVSAMSTIGLNLVREEIRNNIINPVELHWIWRNMSHRSGGTYNLLSKEDLLQFIPILIRENLDNWNYDDFIAFKEIVSIHLIEPEKLFAGFGGDEEILISFLHRWIEIGDFSDKEEETFFYLMKKVSSKKFSAGVEVFIHWVEQSQNKNINLFSFLGKLINVQSEPISAVDLTRLFYVCSRQIKDNNDLNQFDKLISELVVKKEAVDYRNSFHIFLASVRNHKFSKSEQLNTFRSLVNSGQMMGFLTNDILLILFHVVIVAQNAKMLQTLTIILQSEDFRSMHITANKDFESDWYETGQTWVLDTGSVSLVSAYIYVLTKFSDLRIIKDIMTTLLIENSSFFTEVIDHLLRNHHVERTRVAISLAALQELEIQERLQLFSKFLLSARSETSCPTIEETKLFFELVLSIDNMKAIQIENQSRLLMLFQSAKENEICQRIVEHQIRDALNQTPPNFDEAMERLHNLKELMRQTKMKWYIKSGVTPDIRIGLSYIRGLDKKSLQDFLKWFLKAPLDSSPPIDTRYYQATAGLVKLNTQWLTSDPLVRLRLFEETINILQKNK